MHASAELPTASGAAAAGPTNLPPYRLPQVTVPQAAAPPVTVPQPAQVVPPPALTPATPSAPPAPARATPVAPAPVPSVHDIISQSLRLKTAIGSAGQQVVFPQETARASDTNALEPEFAAPALSATNAPPTKPNAWEDKDSLLRGIEYHW